MFFTLNKKIFHLSFVIIILAARMPIFAQTQDVISTDKIETASKYIDQINGKTADELVAYALANNPELEAVRSEVEAAEALIKQANFRANPNLELSGSKKSGYAEQYVYGQRFAAA